MHRVDPGHCLGFTNIVNIRYGNIEVLIRWEKVFVYKNNK